MTRPVRLAELTPEVQKTVLRKAGRKRKPRETTFPAELVRRHALRVLAELATLTQDQRRRVLDHALKVNRV